MGNELKVTYILITIKFFVQRTSARKHYVRDIPVYINTNIIQSDLGNAVLVYSEKLFKLY